MANPISNDDDYGTPDHVYSNDNLNGKGIDYNDDDVIDADLVSDDRVDNDIARNDSANGPTATPTLTEEDFDNITPDNGDL